MPPAAAHGLPEAIRTFVDDLKDEPDTEWHETEMIDISGYTYSFNLVLDMTSTGQ